MNGHASYNLEIIDNGHLDKISSLPLFTNNISPENAHSFSIYNSGLHVFNTLSDTQQVLMDRYKFILNSIVFLKQIITYHNNNEYVSTEI